MTLAELQRLQESTRRQTEPKVPRARDSEVESLINDLMDENDGVNPASILPIDTQLDNQRRRYRQALQFEEVQARSLLALDAIEELGPALLGEEESNQLLNELRDTGEKILATGEAATHSKEREEHIAQGVRRIAQDLFQETHYDKAVAVFSLGVILLPFQQDFWSSLAICERELGNLANAVDAFRTAYDLDPANQGVGLLYVHALWEIGDSEDAQHVLEEVRKLEPESETPALQELLAQLDSLVKQT